MSMSTYICKASLEATKTLYADTTQCLLDIPFPQSVCNVTPEERHGSNCQEKQVMKFHVLFRTLQTRITNIQFGVRRRVGSIFEYISVAYKIYFILEFNSQELEVPAEIYAAIGELSDP